MNWLAVAVLAACTAAVAMGCGWALRGMVDSDSEHVRRQRLYVLGYLIVLVIAPALGYYLPEPALLFGCGFLVVVGIVLSAPARS